MRIRKRPQIASPYPLLHRNPPRDLPPPPSHPPPPPAASEAAATSSTAPAPVAAAAPVKGDGRRVVERADGGGEGLHQDGDPLPIDSNGCTISAASGGGGGDRRPSGGHLSAGMRWGDRDGWMKGSAFACLLSGGDDAGGGQVLQAEDEKLELDSRKRWEIGLVYSNPSLAGAPHQPPPSGHPTIHPLPPPVDNWCKGEMARAFQMKKRRGNDDDDDEDEVYEEEEKKSMVGQDSTANGAHKARRNAATAAATTSNGNNGTGARKKCDDLVVKEETNVNGKKRRSPAVLMEGSRCSRVNGRGWRCCQQTLVGYSLCEHHLGKGRLRSMSSVRCNPKNKNKKGGGENGPTVMPFPSPELRQQKHQCSEDEEDQEESKELKKTRKKFGTVKARSIRCLLDQTNHSTAPPISVLVPPALPPAPEMALPPSQSDGATV